MAKKFKPSTIEFRGRAAVRAYRTIMEGHNPSWLKCGVCKEWDSPDKIVSKSHGRKFHPDCIKRHQRDYYAKNRAARTEYQRNYYARRKREKLMLEMG